MAAVGETHHGQKLVCPGVGILGSQKLQRQANVLVGGHVGKQLKGLEDEPDLMTSQQGQFALRKVLNRATVQKNLPRRGTIQTCDQRQEGRFATARRAENGHRFTGLDRQVHLVEDRQGRAAGTKRLAESSELDSRGCHDCQFR